MLHRTTHYCVRHWLFLSCALLAGAVAHAQNLNITAANASNSAIYTVHFDTQTITVENTDQGSIHPRTLAFTQNGNNDQVDLLVGDNVDGTILRYCGDFAQGASPAANTAGVVVFNQTELGPTNPDGMWVENGTENVYLVNQGSGTSTKPQVWVLEGLSTCQANPPAPTSVLIDDKFGPKATLEETHIIQSPIVLTGAGAPVPALNAGDLLVLEGGPNPAVLLYPGSNGLGPTAKTAAITLINLPPGTEPGGMDVLFTDNSLLVTTSTGTILKYTVDQIRPAGTPTNPPFVSGLGNGQFKVRVGQDNSNVVNGNVIVVVANNNGGQIFSFDALGNPGPTVSMGVEHPQGVTLTNKAYQKLSVCFQDPNTPCNVLGNDGAGHKLINHLVSGGGANGDGNIDEDMCAVQMDPRIAACGSCTNAAKSMCANLPGNQGKYKNGLSVAEACGAGFDNPLHPLVIPNSLCGASGPSLSGFTVVRTRTSIDSGPNGFRLNGKYVLSDSDFTGLPANVNDPTCTTAPFQAAGWGAYPEDGLNPGGNFVLDLTIACATPLAGHGPLSAFFMGLSANFGVYNNGVVGYVTADYTTLLSTITAETQSVALPGPPKTFVLTPPSGGNFTSQLEECIQESEDAFSNSSNFYPGAAQELKIAAYRVFRNAHAESSPPFTAPFAPDGDFPDPSGTDLGLIEATRFSILVRAMTPPGDSSPPDLSSPPSTTSPDIRPIINGTPSPTGASGQPYTYAPATTDFADNPNTPLVYSFTGPSWANLSITNNQALVSGKAKHNGSPFTFVLTATDPCGATQSQTWTVTVSP